MLCLQIPVLERSWQYVLDVQCDERSRSSPLDSCWRQGGLACHQADAAYVAELLAQRRPVPPLFSVVIGLLLSCVMVDVLHCMDLGITAHVVANVFMRCIKKTERREVQTPRKADAGTAAQQ